jgi:nitrogen fixation NifU-like protein
MMIYNKVVQDCFFEPRHTGSIALDSLGVVYFRCEQTKQGALIELYMQCDVKGLITRMCFKTNGNPYVIAALEWLCRESEGKWFDDLSPLHYQTLIQILEIPMPEFPIALQVEDVYKEIMGLMTKKLGSQK